MHVTPTTAQPASPLRIATDGTGRRNSAHSASRSLALALLAAVPALASAHTGADAGSHHGFAAGLMHPFTGLDHLAAMLAVGIWSALALRPVWAAPGAFVALLAVGAVAGFSLTGIPMVEPMIAASLLVCGLLVAWRRSLPMTLGLGLVSLFAFFHGAAHGTELAGDGRWAALAGMVLGTAALHAAGIALGRFALARHRLLQQATGAAIGLLGIVMLARLAA
jgi:urease accessory protein